MGYKKQLASKSGKETPSIAVIVVTRNRPNKLQKCIASIYQNTITPHEVIIVNQGSSSTACLTKKHSKPRLTIIDLPTANLSLGRNAGLERVRSDIVCFTDDDCIVSKNWLAEIRNMFRDSPQCVGIFGRTEPYLASKQAGRYCPCTISQIKKKIIKKPSYHVSSIGYGNNMAFRISVFQQEKPFRPWLGAGSRGMSAEDAELALRLLIKKHTLIYNPKAVLFHDRWLTKKQRRQQNLFYGGGEAACYGYFAFQGHEFAKQVLTTLMRDKRQKLKNIVATGAKLKLNQELWSEIVWLSKELIYIFRGLCTGIWHAYIDKIL